MDKQLTQELNKNETAKAILEVFKTRDRNPRGGMMDLRRVRYDLQEEGVEIVPQDFLRFFKDMEKAGVGKLIQEKGKPMRFKWTRKMKEVGMAVASVAITPSNKDVTVHKSGNTTSTVEIVMMLGPDRAANVSFPKDITKEEMKFLVSTIQSKVTT